MAGAHGRARHQGAADLRANAARTLHRVTRVARAQRTGHRDVEGHVGHARPQRPTDRGAQIGGHPSILTEPGGGRLRGHVARRVSRQGRWHFLHGPIAVVHGSVDAGRNHFGERPAFGRPAVDLHLVAIVVSPAHEPGRDGRPLRFVRVGGLEEPLLKLGQPRRRHDVTTNAGQLRLLRTESRGMPTIGLPSVDLDLLSWLQHCPHAVCGNVTPDLPPLRPLPRADGEDEERPVLLVVVVAADDPGFGPARMGAGPVLHGVPDDEQPNGLVGSDNLLRQHRDGAGVGLLPLGLLRLEGPLRNRRRGNRPVSPGDRLRYFVRLPEVAGPVPDIVNVRIQDRAGRALASLAVNASRPGGRRSIPIQGEQDAIGNQHIRRHLDVQAHAAAAVQASLLHVHDNVYL
mmetsp:Transcript_83519/g.269227  ORF Transcript_83519/g.269227 Transcript_83519/m.269227 type:complete len:402 (+) Transcript_83519:261-1466(+)